jgi:hypothetical protein
MLYSQLDNPYLFSTAEIHSTSRQLNTTLRSTILNNVRLPLLCQILVIESSVNEGLSSIVNWYSFPAPDT